MSQIKIETITDVHIGSGNALILNNEIFETKDEEGYVVYAVIDPRRVFDLIGKEGVEAWVSAIERQRPLSDVMLRYAPAAKARQYSKRMIAKYFDGSLPNPPQIKEYIHNGMGLPYIPGSSLKGAIRTAVLATLARPVANDYRGKTNGSDIEHNLLGSDPYHDVFRFLQVGDATFNYDDCTEALRMVNLNERERGDYWDRSKASVVEALAPHLAAKFQLKLDIDRYRIAKSVVQRMPQEMGSLKALFRTINSHTQYLLKTEHSHWLDREPNDDSDKTTQYIDKIRKLRADAAECEKTNGQSCLLRVGSGSGWRFMTGAWSEKRLDFDSFVVPKSRSNNDSYRQYCFPKTRRLTDGVDLLGFVKLTIEQE